MKKLCKLGVLLVLLIPVFSGCKKDLGIAKKGSPEVKLSLALPTAANNTVTLEKADSSTIALKAGWTNAQYIADTAAGNIALRYQLQVDTTGAFAAPVKLNVDIKRDTAMKVSGLNDILMELGCAPLLSSNVFVRVLCISSIDTIRSESFNFKAIPYNNMPAPKIAVPEALFITGAASGGWMSPIPDTYKFTKVNATTYSLTVQLLGGKDYELITDVNAGNWTPCYRINPADSPAALANGGEFVWDGNGSPYNWGSKLFVTPADNAVYKLTFNFQSATFTVQKM